MTLLQTHILLAVGNGPAHGYAIGKEIEERSDGRIDPSTGALYQALKTLEGEGLVSSVDAPDGAGGDTRRNYFAITAAGRRALAAEIKRMDDLVSVARGRRLYKGSPR